MKTRLLIALFFFFQVSTFSQQIDFFNVGVQDQPNSNITISLKRIGSSTSFHKYIIVNKEEFDLIKKYLKGKDTHKQPSPKSYYKEEESSSGNHDVDSYAVEIIDNKEDLIYFMEGNEESVNFFLKFVDFLNKSGYMSTADFMNNNLLKGIIIYQNDKLKSDSKIDYLFLIFCLSFILVVGLVILFTKKIYFNK